MLKPGATVIMSKFLITGASSPIGMALIKNLIKRGNTVVAVVNPHNTSSQNFNFSQEIEKLEIDLGEASDVQYLCKILKENHKDLTSFIHLAAIRSEDCLDLSVMQRTFQINVFSAWIIAETCLEFMSQKGGNIVFMGSVGHKFGGKPGEFSYAASKFCLEYFPRIFRECGKNGILVNTIRLGATEPTELAERSHHNQPNLERKQLIPIKRAASTEEVVGVILFLISKSAGFIHNQVIACTGGE
jgi:3-oxoacyl-[acyl-carrier protein] reductase